MEKLLGTFVSKFFEKGLFEDGITAGQEVSSLYGYKMPSKKLDEFIIINKNEYQEITNEY